MRRVLAVLALAAGSAASCTRSPVEKPTPAPAAPAPPAPPAPPIPASLVVRAFFRGPVPRPRLIPGMDADEKCAALNKAPVYDQSLVVGPEGQLANAIVHLAAGPAGAPFTPPEYGVVVEIKGCLFQPRIVTARTGQRVRFRNIDPFCHCIHALPKRSNGFNTSLHDNTAPDAIWIVPVPEIIVVKSEVIPWMAAYVGVFDHPYHAVTGADGEASFSMPPPGEHEVALWHEAFLKDRLPPPQRIRVTTRGCIPPVVEFEIR